jgi:hypothetical protein
MQKAVSAAWCGDGAILKTDDVYVEEDVYDEGKRAKEFADPGWRAVVAVYSAIATHRTSFNDYVHTHAGPNVKFSFPEHVTYNRFSSVLSGAWALTTMEVKNTNLRGWELVRGFVHSPRVESGKKRVGELEEAAPCPG